MLVIIVGDDQALRLPIARALGPGRFDLVCAVPSAEVVPALEDGERVAALLVHKTPEAMRLDGERLRKRLGERVTLIAVSHHDGAELESLVGEVDDYVCWEHGSHALMARLTWIARRFASVRTARHARPARATEDLLRAGLSAGPDRLYVWDLASHRVDWPLETDASALPRDRAEFEAAVHPEDRATLVHTLERHLVTDCPFSVAVRRGDEDSGYRLFLDRGAVVGGRHEGRVIGLLTEVEDILLVELSRRLELRRSGVAEIAGALADELSRGLLTAFTNLDAAISTAEPALRRDLEHARGGLQLAFDWTRRLMALGRRQPPQPEYLGLQDVVMDLVDPLARRLGSHIALEVESSELVGVVLADPLHLETVLTILCDRAGKAMPDGGRVRIALSTTSLRDETGPLPNRQGEGRWTKLSVEDEGPHLPAPMTAGLFDPMSHGLEEGLRWTIALATVRSIVLQHEGFIRARNLEAASSDGEGRGVVFEIFLPLVARPPARLRRPDTGSHVPLGRGELILVADDDELVRRMMERLLRGAGYEVLLADDGREAVRLYLEHRDRLALVILDIVMPEMGGRVASQRMLAEGAKLPFLFVSGYTMTIADTEFVQDPGRRFLPKPFNAGQLLREVHLILHS